MTTRDNKGRFEKGHIEELLTRDKRLKSLKISAKKKESYLGELKKHPLYNIWRSFKFTKKGKKVGNSPDWDVFKNFYNDVIPFFEEGKRFNRIDITKPHGKDNFIFLTDYEVALRFKTEKLLTYKGESKTIDEWIIELDLSEEGVRQRFYQGKKYNHSSERILFGTKYNKAKERTDFKKLEFQRIRDKASKMISSYNNKDKKRGLEKSNLTIEWFVDNIFNSQCVYCGDTENIGADRKDNSKNHDMYNIVPCCYDCNVARANNFTHNEMFIIGKAIKEIKEERKTMANTGLASCGCLCDETEKIQHTPMSGICNAALNIG